MRVRPGDRLRVIPIGPRAGEVGDDYLDGGEGIDRLYGGPDEPIQLLPPTR